MSTRPNSPSAFAAIASTSSFLPTSAMIGSALTPRSCASRATAFASCSFERALTTTYAPSWASFNTVARPILRPDPVTRATLPSSLPMRPSHNSARQVEGNRMRWQPQTGTARGEMGVWRGRFDWYKARPHREAQQMERKKASDFPQELLNLLDGYVHGGVSRRQFLA